MSFVRFMCSTAKPNGLDDKSGRISINSEEFVYFVQAPLSSFRISRESDSAFSLGF